MGGRSRTNSSPARPARLRCAIVAAASVLIACGAAAAPAQATFHLNMVNEVMLASSAGDTGTQFVEFLDNGGTEEQFTPVFAPYKLVVYDAAGNELGEQTLNPSGLRAAATADREYLVSTAAADAAFGVTGDERLTVTLPVTAGQVCFAGNEPAPHAVSCMSYGTITHPVQTNSEGTGSVHGPVPPNGESDQRQPDRSVVAAPPTPKARNRGAPPPPSTPGPPTLTRPSLGGLATGRVTLRFTVRAGSNAPGVSRLLVKLPRGLSWVAAKVGKDLVVSGPGGARLTPSATITHGELRVSLPAPAATVSVRLARGAIHETSTLRQRAEQHRVRSLTVAVSATDSHGTTTTLKQRARLG